MRKLLVRDLIEIQDAETNRQEYVAVALALGITLEELMDKPAKEFFTWRDQVITENGLGSSLP